MWQQTIVFCLVAAAALHLGARYLPARWRRRGSAFLARRGALGARLAAWLDPAAGCGGGCSSCGSCGSEGKVVQPSGSASRQVIVRIPKQR
jgi:hypothetical protein